ncbi:hypothetical protein EEL32_06495 [Brevibacillus laterosporus]|nr:hypothetical protein EEL32_06495 [Brevibacillus laterosporus]
MFGLTNLLGFKFTPRIRDLSDSKLFTIDKASKYPKLEAILRGQINTKNPHFPDGTPDSNVLVT